MGQTLGVDYSFSRPSPAEIKAFHAFVMRYLTGSGKAVSRVEIDALHAQGLGVGFVFESTAGRSAAGRAAGTADARAALSAANALGVPAAVPLFFAVDFDAVPTQVARYFAGVSSVLGARAGVYGSYTITTAGLAPWRWQTMAWSRGKIDPQAHLIQRIGMTHPIPGCDENVLQRPLAFWGPVVAPKSTPAPAPTGFPVTPARALKRIRDLAARRVNIGIGACQANAHDIYGIPTDGTKTAALAWAKAKHRHNMDKDPTRGAWVFWTGGHTIVDGQPAGHVAVWSGRDPFNPLKPFAKRTRWVWSPGAPPDALGGWDPSLEYRWVRVPIRAITQSKAWPGHVLQGWTEDIDGVRVPGLAPRS
jgi:hypothetical protein